MMEKQAMYISRDRAFQTGENTGQRFWGGKQVWPVQGTARRADCRGQITQNWGDYGKGFRRFFFFPLFSGYGGELIEGFKRRIGSLGGDM